MRVYHGSVTVPSIHIERAPKQSFLIPITLSDSNEGIALCLGKNVVNYNSELMLRSSEGERQLNEIGLHGLRPPK